MNRANEEFDGLSAGVAPEDALNCEADIRPEQRRYKSRLNDFRTESKQRVEPERLRRIEAELQDLRRLVTELTASNSGPSSYHESNHHRSIIADSTNDVVDQQFENFEPRETSATSRLLRIVLVNPDEATKAELIASSLTSSDEFEPGSLESLEAEIAQRDGYIVYLSQQLRDIAVRIEAWLRLLAEERNSNGTQAALYDAQDTVSRILKLSEVELSVERAKLARERAQLEIAWQELADDRRAPAEPVAPVDDNATPLMRRWDRFFPPSKTGRQS